MTGRGDANPNNPTMHRVASRDQGLKSRQGLTAKALKISKDVVNPSAGEIFSEKPAISKKVKKNVAVVGDPSVPGKLCTENQPVDKKGPKKKAVVKNLDVSKTCQEKSSVTKKRLKKDADVESAGHGTHLVLPPHSKRKAEKTGDGANPNISNTCLERLPLKKNKPQKNASMVNSSVGKSAKPPACNVGMKKAMDISGSSTSGQASLIKPHSVYNTRSKRNLDVSSSSASQASSLRRPANKKQKKSQDPSDLPWIGTRPQATGGAPLPSSVARGRQSSRDIKSGILSPGQDSSQVQITVHPSTPEAQITVESSPQQNGHDRKVNPRFSTPQNSNDFGLKFSNTPNDQSSGVDSKLMPPHEDRSGIVTKYSSPFRDNTRGLYDRSCPRPQCVDLGEHSLPVPGNCSFDVVKSAKFSPTRVSLYARSSSASRTSNSSGDSGTPIRFLSTNCNQKDANGQTWNGVKVGNSLQSRNTLLTRSRALKKETGTHLQDNKLDSCSSTRTTKTPKDDVIEAGAEMTLTSSGSTRLTSSTTYLSPSPLTQTGLVKAEKQNNGTSNHKVLKDLNRRSLPREGQSRRSVSSSKVVERGAGRRNSRAAVESSYSDDRMRIYTSTTIKSMTSKFMQKSASVLNSE